MTYLDPELLDDETAVAEGILAAQADQIEGWAANEGDVETSESEAYGMVAAAIVAMLKAQLREAYADSLIRGVFQLARTAAVSSSVVLEVTMATAAGYTIPAGFSAVLATSTGDEIDFATDTDLVIAAGQTVGNVTAYALEPGADGDGAYGPAVDYDRVVDVVSVTAPTPSGGGADEEDLDSYLDRGIKHAKRLNHVPATPLALAVFGLDVAGVARTLAVNRANPATPGVDAPGHVTIYAAGADGTLAGSTQTALQAYYDALEVIMGAVPHVAGPTDVDVTIAVTITPADGIADADAQTAASDVLAAALTKSAWAYDEDADTNWDPTKTQLTIFDVSALIDDLPELATVVDVKINGGTAPVAIPYEGLVNATSITVTVA